MNDPTIAKPTKGIVAFFVLTFLVSSPAYILSAIESQKEVFPQEMVPLLIFLLVLGPIIAALILTFKESGFAGLKKLLAGYLISRYQRKFGIFRYSYFSQSCGA